MYQRSIAAGERASLCDLFEQVGPDAPTLCEGWTTHDLAAHLWLRERRPHLAAGLLVGGAVRAATERATERAKARGYDRLVRDLRKGPPVSLRGRDNLLHLHEFFVHHEDVRRAQDGWTDRTDGLRLDIALWGILRFWGRMLTRRVRPAGVVLAWDGRTRRARRGEPVAVVRGTPQELFLFLFGRRGVADVEIEGPPEARAALEHADFGF